MSDAGGPDFGLFGEATIGLNEEAVRRLFAEFNRLIDQQNEKIAAAYKAHFARLRTMTNREYDLLLKMEKESARDRQAEREKADRRDIGRINRLGARQKAAAKERLQTQMASDAAVARQETRSNQTHQKNLDHLLKMDRAAERRALTERIRQLERELALVKASEKRRTQTEQMGHKERLSQQQTAERSRLSAQKAAERAQAIQQNAAEDRSTARHKAYWSIVRSITETSTRFVASSIRDHYARRFAAQNTAESREEASLRQSEERKQNILRSSYADQQAITTRALARQQGAIAAFQRTTQTGLLGSLFRTRNLLLGAGGFLSARAIFGPVAEYEQTRISFNGLLRGMARVRPFLAKLRDLTIRTPFDFPGLTEGARRLLAAGFAARDVIPTFTTLGNVASSLGAGTEEINGVVRALGQARGKGRLMAEEIQQIAEQFVGFPAMQVLAEGLGMTTEEVFDRMKRGELGAEEGIAALIEGMENFGPAQNAMARQSRTLLGRLSSLKDVFHLMLVDALQPLAKPLANLMGTFTTFLLNLKQGEGVWAVVRSGLLGIAVGMAAILAVKGAVTVMQLMGTALGVLAAHPLIAGLALLGATVSILVRHVPGVSDFFEALGGGLERAAHAIGAGGRLGRLWEDLLAFDFDSVGRRLAHMFHLAVIHIGPILEPVVGVVRDWLVNAFEVADEWLHSEGANRIADGVRDAINIARTQVGDFFSALFGGGAGASGGSQAGDRINTFVTETLLPALSNIGNAIMEVIHGINWAEVGTAVLQGIRAVGEFLGGPVVRRLLSRPVLTAVGAIIAALGAALGALLIGLIQGLADSIPDVLRDLGAWVDQLMAGLVQRFARTPVAPLVRALRRVLGRVFSLLASAFDFVGSIVDLITGRGDWGDVGEALMDMLGEALGAIVDVTVLTQAMVEVIGRALEGVADWLSSLHNIESGPLGGLIRVFVAPVEFAVGIIADLLDRLAQTIRGIVDVIVGIFTGDWARAWEGIKGLVAAAIGIIRDIIARGFSLVGDIVTGFGQFLLRSLGAIFRAGLDLVSGWIESVLDFFRDLPGRIGGLIRDIVDAMASMGRAILRGLIRGIGGAVGLAGDIASTVGNAIIDFVNEHLIGGINDALDFEINAGPVHVHINPPDIPHIPHFATGGIVTRPTIALLGEAGPEAVVPLTSGSPALGLDASGMTPLGDRLVEMTTPGMQRWTDFIDGVLERILNRFERWTVEMADTALHGGENIVMSLVASLNKGVSEVGRIVGSYAAELARGLNPILRAIGEDTIRVRTFREGGFNPRIAEGGEGPQVHVFNEAGRHGEAYIPFDPTYRSGARDIADRTARRLGGRIQWFREGGITSTVGAGDSLPNVSGDVVGLVTEFARRISTWATSRGQNFNVTSGFRTYSEQVAAWHRYLAGTGALAAVPGSSMHEVGLAVDGPHWGAFNPAAFGIHYPVPGEAWHAEPVEGRGLLHGDTQFFPGINPLPRPPGNVGQRGWLSRVARAAMDYIYDKALTYAGQAQLSPDIPSLGTAGASPGVMAGIRRAMSIVGVPGSWLGPLLTLISRESGFNPRAYNGILGASGLMQTIPSTFAAYHLPAFANIFGIVDNVIAGLRYILSRYGSIFNVGQATASSPTSGYRYGGITRSDQTAFLHRNEMILPLGDRRRTMALIQSSGLGDMIAAALVGPNVGVADLSPTGSGSGPSITTEGAPFIGEQHNVFQTNASDPEAVSVALNARLRSTVSRVRVGA